MEKYGFVYIWYDRKRKMYYIGSHWGTVDDGYICSSKWMRDNYRYRPEDFKRRILKTDIPRENLLDEEFKWLQQIKHTEIKHRYYNLNHKYHGHWAHNPDTNLTVGQKISKTTKGVPKPNVSKALTGRKLTLPQLEHLRNRMLTDNPFKGRRHTQASRDMVSQKNIGRKHTTEDRCKISLGLKGRKYSEQESLAHSEAAKNFYRNRNIKISTPYGTFNTVKEAHDILKEQLNIGYSTMTKMIDKCPGWNKITVE